MLYRFHKFVFVALLEPFQHYRNINRYKNRLRMQDAKYNKYGQIWVFINQGYDVTIINDTDQQLTLNL